MPKSERQVRALSKADNPTIVWKEAQKLLGKEQPTSKEIEQFIADQDNTETGEEIVK